MTRVSILLYIKGDQLRLVALVPYLGFCIQYTRKEFNMIRYERRLFYKAFLHSNEMIDVLNHDRVRKSDIIAIYTEDRYIVVIYEKIVEVTR